MQTRFAVVTLHNAEAQVRAKILVGYCGGRWSAMKIDRRAEPLLLRESGVREERVANMRTGLGTVANTTKPLTEIAMLLKRHAQLMSRTYYYDDPMDWRVEENKEVTVRELLTMWSDAVRAAMSAILQRLYSGGRTSSGASRTPTQQLSMTNRINDLVANLNARQHALITGQREMFSYVGALASAPGVTWRGLSYSEIDAPHFKRRREMLSQLGGVIRGCIAHSRRGENYEGLYNELLEMLRREDDSYGDIYELLGNAGSVLNVKEALAKINGCTILVGDCGHFFEDGTGHRVAQRTSRARLHWCEQCFQERTVSIADLPGTRWPREQAYHSDRHTGWYSYDIDAAEVPERNEPIMSYSTNVTRICRPDLEINSSHYGDFLLGFELEMTSGRDIDPHTAARDVRRRLGPDYCIVKSDGSLPSNGFEVVTAPRGIAEHVRRVTGWEINSSYRAWDTNACGLHVHIHSRAFTEMSLGKFIMFYNMSENAQFIRKLAGRHPFKDIQAGRYCAQEDQQVLDNPKAAIKGKGYERYRMINTTNLSRAEAERLGLPNHGSGRYDTVEVRIYKASLRKERLLAQLEFTHAAVMFCRVASYRDLTGGTFVKWLAPNAKMYPNLANWFGVRASKALKDAKAKSLEEKCLDKVTDPDAAPAPVVRPVRRARTLSAYR